MHKQIQIVLTPLVAAALLFSVTPASAAPGSLPAGDSLYMFGCDGGGTPAVGLVDVASGAVTEVVPQVNVNQCYGGAAYNAVDGLIHVINNDRRNSFWGLAVFDPEEATLTFLDQFSAGCEPDALAIDGSGNAWVDDDGSNTLRPVNLEDGTCGTGVFVSDGGGYADISALSFAPDGTLYGISANGGTIGTINTTTGAFTQVGSSAAPSDSGGLTFDSSGTAWVLDQSNEAEIYSADIANYAGTVEPSGQLTFENQSFYSDGIAVLRAPATPEPETEELAETGVDGVARGAIGVAAAGLIALGAAVRIVRRRAS